MFNATTILTPRLADLQDIVIPIDFENVTNFEFALWLPRELHQRSGVTASANMLGGVRLNQNGQTFRSQQFLPDTVGATVTWTQAVSLITVVTTGTGSASSNRTTRTSTLNLTITADRQAATITIRGVSVTNREDINVPMLMNIYSV
jgi:hypothetical protein